MGINAVTNCLFRSTPQLQLLFATCVLLAITVVLFELTPRYIGTGNELLTNGDFSNQLDGWQVSDNADVSVANGVLTLTSSAKELRPEVWQSFPAPAASSVFLIGAELAVEGILPGDKSWKKARLMAFSQISNSSNERPHSIAAIALNRDWQRFRGIVAFDSNPQPFRVVIEIVHTTGTLHARSISLQRAKINPYFNAVYFLLFGLWTLLIGWIVFVLYRHSDRHPVHPLSLLLLISIIIGLLMPASGKHSALILINNLLPFSFNTLTYKLGSAITPVHYFTEWLDAGKVGHFFIFGVLSIVLSQQYAQRNSWLFFASLFTLCASTEAMQYFVPGRTPAISDIGVDFVGMLLGLLIHRVGISLLRTGSSTSV